jgi:hypothetical protein
VRVRLKLGSRQIKVGFYWRSGVSGLKADSSLKEIIEVIRQFDVAGAVPDQELRAMVKLAEELKNNTLAWLRNFHPELLKA